MPSPDLSVPTEAPPSGAPASSVRTGGPVDVVVGPRTRLGGALLAEVEGTGGVTVAVARDDRDARALADRSDVLVAAADDTAFAEAVAGRSVRLHVCALGPVHPESVDPTDQAVPAAVERDLAVIGRLLAAARGSDVHVVLVSTVIALAPGEDRRHYGGWKDVVEERLRVLVGQHPRAVFSVLYPGRLVAARDARRPWQLAYTTYRRLATLSLSVAEGPARGRIVGADARVWLVLRGLALGLTGLTGRAGTARPAAGRRTKLPPREV